MYPNFELGVHGGYEKTRDILLYQQTQIAHS
jgi:hypothetical protein